MAAPKPTLVSFGITLTKSSGWTKCLPLLSTTMSSKSRKDCWRRDSMHSVRLSPAASVGTATVTLGKTAPSLAKGPRSRTISNYASRRRLLETAATRRQWFLPALRRLACGLHGSQVLVPLDVVRGAANHDDVRAAVAIHIR